MKRVEQKERKKVCVECWEHRALFRYRGVVKWDRHHTLCFRCWHGQADSIRAALAVAQPSVQFARAA